MLPGTCGRTLGTLPFPGIKMPEMALPSPAWWWGDPEMPWDFAFPEWISSRRCWGTMEKLTLDNKLGLRSWRYNIYRFIIMALIIPKTQRNCAAWHRSIPAVSSSWCPQTHSEKGNLEQMGDKSWSKGLHTSGVSTTISGGLLELMENQAFSLLYLNSAESPGYLHPLRILSSGEKTQGHRYRPVPGKASKVL